MKQRSGRLTLLCLVMGAWGCDGPPGAVVDAGQDGGAEDQCAGKNDFSPCELITDPDLSYDICIQGACVSPGCGDESCNVPGPHFPLPDTGQRLCYDDQEQVQCPEPGQDHFGQDAQFGWDTSHPAGSRFDRDLSVPGEPVVVDGVTGLAWQGCTLGHAGDDCQADVTALHSWEDAVTACDRLAWGGFDDWRLPDEFELMTLLHRGTISVPLIDDDAFPATPAEGFWSSSSQGWSAWFVSFDRGGVGHTTKLEEETWGPATRMRVRCVRHAPVPRPTRFDRDTSVAGQPTVPDAWTGLTWQGCSLGRSGNDCGEGEPDWFDWKAALERCRDLSWGGHDDWRLPDATELRSIVNNRRTNSSVDPAAFPHTPSNAPHWTSSTRSTDPAEAWVVSFYSGSVIPAAKPTLDLARCVRGPWQDGGRREPR
jgi:hypothetical protein